MDVRRAVKREFAGSEERAEKNVKGEVTPQSNLPKRGGENEVHRGGCAASPPRAAWYIQGKNR